MAQNAEIQQLIRRFATEQLNGWTAQQLEILVRTAVFKSANEVGGFLFQQHRVDAEDHPVRDYESTKLFFQLQVH